MCSNLPNLPVSTNPRNRPSLRKYCASNRPNIDGRVGEDSIAPIRPLLEIAYPDAASGYVGAFLNLSTSSPSPRCCWRSLKGSSP
jgi:hypothetical protein